MVDFVGIVFDLVFKYCNFVIILVDGVIGQMMEKVVLFEQCICLIDEEVIVCCLWVIIGRIYYCIFNIIILLEFDFVEMEKCNIYFQKKYVEIEENEVCFEEFYCEDVEYLIVVFGFCVCIV